MEYCRSYEEVQRHHMRDLMILGSTASNQGLPQIIHVLSEERDLSDSENDDAKLCKS